ncbi:hypothetical protein CJI54_02050 [Bifidobacteriaceae bacterium NR026]|nr:hypothetical protein CJI54_02050 [Bifidobacteriaceae bacterium NR026]
MRRRNATFLAALGDFCRGFWVIFARFFFGQHVRVRSNLFGCSKFYKSFLILASFLECLFGLCFARRASRSNLCVNAQM